MGFAQNLDRIMQEKEITKYRLAKSLDVHPTTIKNWLEGHTQPKFEMIDKIAQILDVKTDDLLVTDVDDVLARTMQLMVESMPETQLRNAFNKLNEAGKKVAIERVEELTEIPKYTNSDIEDC